LGITILIKIQTEQQNETEQSLAAAPLIQNAPAPENSPLVSTETTIRHREKHSPECAHYFGYVSSGEKIPEDCLTCSRLLKCLTSKSSLNEEK